MLSVPPPAMFLHPDGASRLPVRHMDRQDVHSNPEPSSFPYLIARPAIDNRSLSIRGIFFSFEAFFTHQPASQPLLFAPTPSPNPDLKP